MADLSDETLTFIVNRARPIHHGEIRIIMNQDSKDTVSIEVVEKERFRTDDKVLPVQRPPRGMLEGASSVEDRRRG